MRGDAAPVQKNDSQDRSARPEKRAPGGGFSRAMRAEENRGGSLTVVNRRRGGSLTVVNRRRGRKGLCGLIFFVKFENNACSMG